MKNIISVIVLIHLNLFSQTNKVDSLYNALKISKTDTGKINTINSLASELIRRNIDSAFYFSQKAIELSNKINFKLGALEGSYISSVIKQQKESNSDISAVIDSLINQTENLKIKNEKDVYSQNKLLARMYRTLGNNYDKIANYDKAVEYYKKCIVKCEKIKLESFLGAMYLQLGWAYNRAGNYSNAIKYHFLSLKVSEKLKNNLKIASSYNAIGAVYMAQKKWNDALFYLNKTVEIGEKNDLFGILVSANYNIATIYISENNPQKAIAYADKASTYSLKENNPYGRTLALLVLADSYSGLNKHDLAINVNKEALTIAENLADSNLIANCYVSMTHKYKCAGNMREAIKYGESAFGKCQRIDAKELLSILIPFLTECYSKTNNYKKAFELKVLEVQINDSISSENNEREILNQSYQYQYQKKSLADSLEFINQKKITQLQNQSKLKEEQNKRFTLYVVLILLLALAGFIFNRFKATQKQKILIEHQGERLKIAHLNLEEKTKEVQDSIIYSKEIQNIFLKSITNSKEYFSNSIMYYKPKAVVSGDFYWYKEINDNLYVVVGDCTGHGVPGAIISVLAIQSLEKTILQLTNVEKLHQLNEFMNDEFKQYYNQDNYVSIGLDFSIICINKTSRKLYVSGSGATILLKNKSNELLVEKFASINIGGIYPRFYSPNTVCYDMDKLQAVYLYSDGIVDQKGEFTHKKYSTKKLKNLIVNLNTTSATEALTIIEKELNDWKGNSIQIDDMTLLGIQFSS